MQQPIQADVLGGLEQGTNIALAKQQFQQRRQAFQAEQDNKNAVKDLMQQYNETQDPALLSQIAGHNPQLAAQLAQIPDVMAQAHEREQAAQLKQMQGNIARNQAMDQNYMQWSNLLDANDPDQLEEIHDAMQNYATQNNLPITPAIQGSYTPQKGAEIKRLADEAKSRQMQANKGQITEKERAIQKLSDPNISGAEKRLYERMYFERKGGVGGGGGMGTAGVRSSVKLSSQENKRIIDLAGHAEAGIDALQHIDQAEAALGRGIGKTGGAAGIGKYVGNVTALFDKNTRTNRQQYEAALQKIASTMAKTYGANPSEYETKLIEKMQAGTSYDTETMKQILHEARDYMQRKVDKHEFVVDAVDNGMRPMEAEKVFNKQFSEKYKEKSAATIKTSKTLPTGFVLDK